MQSEGDEMYSTVFEIGPKKSHKKLDSIKTQFPDRGLPMGDAKAFIVAIICPFLS